MNHFFIRKKTGLYLSLLLNTILICLLFYLCFNNSSSPLQKQLKKSKKLITSTQQKLDSSQQIVSHLLMLTDSNQTQLDHLKKQLQLHESDYQINKNGTVEKLDSIKHAIQADLRELKQLQTQLQQIKPIL